MLNRSEQSWGTALIYWYPICLLSEEWRERYRGQITRLGATVFSYLPFVEGAEDGIEIILPSITRDAGAKRRIISRVEVPNRELLPYPESVERVLLTRKYRHQLNQLRIVAGETSREELSEEFWQMYNETIAGYSKAYPLPNGRLELYLPQAIQMSIKWEAGKKPGRGSYYTYRLNGSGTYIRIFPATYGRELNRFFPTLDLKREKSFPISPDCGETALCRVYWLMARDRRVTGLAFPV
ncbi:MAG: hypothetical protein Q7K33_01950 [Candidatus Berkelbacteria bacterium]|nr:hypothetical protein [Candidatus Berkelbacteria bacterium]